MTHDDFARLHRFRIMAQGHQLRLPDTEMRIDMEIEHLREQLNAEVYLKAEQWMLPSWVILSLKDLDTKKSLISKLPNNLYRNWSLVGGVGSKRYGITDSRGLVTATPNQGSIDIWVLKSDGIVFPALMGKDGPQLKLVSTDDQLYEWKTSVGSVDFTRLIYYIETDGLEFLNNEVILKNIALEEKSISFYVCLRPMSMLGVEPIWTLNFDAETNKLFANETLALQTELAPSAVYMVKANDSRVPEVVQSDMTRYDTDLHSEDGLGMAILRFNITLPPAGTKNIVFSSPLQQIPEELLSKVKPMKESRDLSIGNWYNFSDKRGEAIFPDDRLSLVFSQAAASLAIQSYSTFHPDGADIESSSSNWQHRMRILIALVKSGAVDVAREVMTQIVQKLKEVNSLLNIEISSPLLWGLLQLHGYSPQKESIHEYNQIIKQLTEGVITTLNIDRPLEKRRNISDENLDETSEDAPLEHYSVLNPSMLKDFNALLWTLGALHEGLSYFSLTELSLATEIRNIISHVENQAHARLDEIRKARWPRPQDPMMIELDVAILDILTGIVQLRLDGFDMKYLRSLCNKVTERRVIRNLWKIKGSSETFSSHLALRIAQFHVWDQQRDAAEPLLLRALEFLSEDYLLPELVNSRTYGGGGGTGSSIFAAADIILLLSDMLVHENKNNLIFLAGVPSEWFTATKPLVIKGLNTKFGKTRIDIGLSANQHQIETGMEILPDEIEVHVPETVPLRMVKIYGGSIIDRALKDRSPHIKLVPLSNDVVLTYHR